MKSTVEILKTDEGMLEWQNMLQMHQDEQEIENTESIEGYNELPSNNQTHTNRSKRLDGKPNSNRDSFFHVHKNKQTNKPTQLNNDNQLRENNGNLGTISKSNRSWETGRHFERPKSPDISQWAQKEQQAQAQRLQLAQKQKQAKAQNQFESLQRAQQEHDTNSNKESILIKEKDEKTSRDKNIQNTLKGTKQPTQQDHDINSYKEQIKMLNILVKEKDNKIARLETIAEVQSGSVCNKNGTMIYRLVTKEEYENLQHNRRNTNYQKKSTQINNDAQSCKKEMQTSKNLERPKGPNTSVDINTQNAQKGPKPPTQRDHDTNTDKEQIKMLNILLKEKEMELGYSTQYNKLYREDINTLNIVQKKKKEQLAKKDAEIYDTNQVLKEVMEQFNSCKYNVEKLQAKVLQLEQEVEVSKEVIWRERRALENKAIVNKLVMENYDKENATLKKENAKLKKEKEYLIFDHKRQETENQELKKQLRVTKENYEDACKFTRKLLEEKEKQDREKKANFVQKAPARPNFVQRVSERPKETCSASSKYVSRIPKVFFYSKILEIAIFSWI